MEKPPLFGEIVAIPIDLIDVSNRLRPVDSAHVEAIAASIAQIGLMSPIILRPAGNRYLLVAGAHRLAAVMNLDWQSIDGIVENIDENEARLVEIDENLMRRELSALDRAIFLAERRAVYEALNPEAKPLGRKPKKLRQSLPQFGMAFTKHAAQRTGLAERTVRLSLELVKNLHPEALALLRLSDIADNQAHLLALAKAEPEQQVAIAHEIAGGRASTPKQARLALGFDVLVEQNPQEKLFVQFLGLWARMEAPTRRRVANHLAGVAKKKSAP